MSEVAGNLKRWAPLLTVALIAVAAILAGRVLAQFSVHDVIQSIHRLEPGRLALAGVFAAGSYLTLTAFDYLGIRYAGRRLPYPKVALTTFVALGIGHTVGLAPLSSGAVRFRFYSRWGLRAAEIGLVVVFSALTVAVGEISVAAISLVTSPDLGARIMKIEPATALALGIGYGTILVLYVLACVMRREPFRLWRVTIPMVPWRLALAQIAVGTVNYLLVVAALHQTLSAPVPYMTVATAYVLANLAALLSHVPGGLGVIEAVLVALLPGADVIGGVLAFRVIYFLVPFVLGSALFVGAEIRFRAQGVQ